MTFTALVLCVASLLTHSLAAQPAPAAPIRLQLDPARSGATISLTGNFHTVEGSFALKRGSIQFDPETGKANGEIVFDATSGKTGNDGRDHKMHESVLESARFPEILFRPDHANGAFAASGDSTLQVHGVFAIHGGEHEITIPVELHLRGDASQPNAAQQNAPPSHASQVKTWSAKASFQVPYAKWGMKNPSVLFLRVDGFVDVQFHAEGMVLQ